MVALPQELVDAIIDRVLDRPSLKSCSLVATPFLSTSQRCIFRSLCVYRGQSQRRPNLTAASTFLTASPRIASYVRDLLIEIPNSAPESALLKAVLSALQNLERLVISGKSVSWNVLEPGARSTLLKSITLPSLYRLHVVNVKGAPRALIAAAISIPVVSFYGTRMDEREGPGSTHNTPRLRHLILSDAGPHVLATCDILLPSISQYTSQIERLELRIDPYSTRYDQRLLTACASTLQYLVIDPGALIEPIDVPHMPRVRGLELKVFIDNNRRLPALFSSTLSQLASSLPLVETITLSFVVEPVHPEAPWPDSAPFPILADRMQLLHLRAVHCRLLQRNMFGSADALFGHFVAAMEARMPGLQGTRILTCTLADPQRRYVDRLP